MTTLLVELFCEELPPKALRRLGEAFADGLQRGLAKREMLASDSAVRAFATPRRLAASIKNVKAASEPRAMEVKLMPASVGLDASGRATPALAKKLEAAGLAGTDVAKLQRRVDGKAEMLFAQSRTPAMPLAQALQGALDEAIAGLPIPKVMTYQLADGETTVQFVRPAHALVALHGAEVVPVKALGLEAGRASQGHRFQGAAEVTFANADAYEATLERDGRVIASFDARRAEIAKRLEEKARPLAPSFQPPEALLDEVTGLVEWPAVYVGSFDAEFLAVPQECLVLTMQQNQKYFPLSGADGKLLPKFLIVSNMRLDDAKNIVQGNERVVRPRLADARFFFDTDRKVKLADRVAQLQSIVYHNKLGTQRERVDRLVKLAMGIQEHLPRGAAGIEWAVRAAYLAKADLVTLMVGEFPELQGVMGRYYAEADGEQPSVVRAIEQHYWPRFAGDKLPVGDASIAVALADKLEAIVGMFGIGAQPTGDKDPFALRRHAIGVVRILVEGGLDLSLNDLVNRAVDVFRKGAIGDAGTDVVMFIHDRLRGYLRDRGYSAHEIEAAMAKNPDVLSAIPGILAAVRDFTKLPEAASLAAANKRVANILRQSAEKGESFANADPAALKEPAEVALRGALATAKQRAEPLLAKKDYSGYLTSFATLKAPVDKFFDDVMVMVDDPVLRRNRLALLADLREAMNRIADISKLAA